MADPKPIPLPDGRFKMNVRSYKFGTTPSGQPKARTQVFDKKSDATNWARDLKSELAGQGKSDYHDMKKITVGGVLRAFIDRGIEVMVKPSGHKSMRNRLNKIVREQPQLCMLNMTHLPDVQRALLEYKEQRVRSGIDPSTAARDLASIGCAFRWLKNKEKVAVINPVMGIEKGPATSRNREYVWTDEMFNAFLEAAEFDPEKKPEQLKDLFPWAMLLARATGYRASEIRAIPRQTPEQAKRRKDKEWSGYIDLSEREIYFPGTVTDAEGRQHGGRKSDEGKGWAAPLMDEAVAILERLLEWFPIDENADLSMAPDRLLPFTSDYFKLCFDRLKKAVLKAHPEWREELTRPQHVTFHGLRHTWTTQLVDSYVDPAKGSLDEATTILLKKQTGRRSTASLSGYVHLKSGAVAKNTSKRVGTIGAVANALKSKTPAPAKATGTHGPLRIVPGGKR